MHFLRPALVAVALSGEDVCCHGKQFFKKTGCVFLEVVINSKEVHICPHAAENSCLKVLICPRIWYTGAFAHREIKWYSPQNAVRTPSLRKSLWSHQGSHLNSQTVVYGSQSNAAGRAGRLPRGPSGHLDFESKTDK